MTRADYSGVVPQAQRSSVSVPGVFVIGQYLLVQTQDNT